MRRVVTGVASSAIVLLGLLLGTALPTRAITGNYGKDVAHPFVGLVVFYDASGAFLWRCSGTLLTSRVLLTAGHCTSPDPDEGTPVSARVYFQQDAGVRFNPDADPPVLVDPVTGYPDTCVAGTEALCKTSHALFNYDYPDAGYPDTHDLGLVILDEPVSVGAYGALAGPGTLDRLATRRGLQTLLLAASGYGVTDAREHPASRALSFRERLMATVRVVNLRSANTAGFNLQTSANAGKGRGGTCYGDSGGPLFSPADSNVVVSVTSFGLSPWCTGVDFSYRVDTQAAHAWILATVTTAVSAQEAHLIQIVEPATPSASAAAPADPGTATHRDAGTRKHHGKGPAKEQRHQGKGHHRR